MFRYSICDPLKKDPIEMGEIEGGKILDVVDRFPWIDMLDKMNKADPNQIHFSPSLEFENSSTRHGITISLVDGESGTEFYIFYKRPKVVTKLFGLIRKVEENYLSDRTGQTEKDIRAAVTALIDHDTTTLEKRWG